MWCGADCEADCEADAPDHAADCPQSTGLYPGGGECCCVCGDPVGEYYVLRPDEPTFLLPGVVCFKVLCVPCGVAG